MADCTALDAASFIGNFISDATAFTGLPQHYQNALNDASFYCELRKHVIEDQLQGVYQHGAAQQLAKVIGVMSSAFMTMWVMMQGFKIINGTLRTPVLELAFQAAKMVLVLTLISLTLGNTPWITEQVTLFQESIAIFLTGSSTKIDDLIDFNVAATSLIDLVIQDMSGKGGTASPVMGSNSLTAGWVGQMGPAMLAAGTLLLARVAIVLAIMLSPLFLFFSLFDKTSSLFWGWLRKMLALFFAMAGLSIVVVISLEVMSLYGFKVFLSMLVNQMSDTNILRPILIALLTDSAAASIDVGGGLTRLAMMGAFFSSLITAVPVLILMYFDTAINLAAQGLHSMSGTSQGGMAPGGNAQMSGYPYNLNNQSANPSSLTHNAAGGSGGLSGSAALNQQIQQSIAARAVPPAGGPPGGGAGSGPSGGPPGGGAMGARPGLQAAQNRQQGLNIGGELRANPTTGVYETPSTAQSMRSDPSLGSGGHLSVASAGARSDAAGGSVGGAAVAEVANAAVVRSENGLSYGSGVVQAPNPGVSYAPSYAASPSAPEVPSVSAVSSTPVHSLAPPGAAQTVPPSVRSAVFDVSAREVRNPSAPRPTLPERR